MCTSPSKQFSFVFAVFLMACGIVVSGQTFEASLGIHGFADNREYGKSNRYPQTFFGTRVAPELGLSVDSTHRIRIGLDYLYEFGARDISTPIKPIAYYNYRKNGFDFKIGAFPRQPYVDKYPKAILSDTIAYYQPNIEGMLVRYQNSRTEHQLWIDWNSRQTRQDREQFRVGASGNFKITNSLFAQYYAVLWHNAGRMFDDTEEDYVQDNAVASFHIGADLSDRGWLDSIRLTIGYIANYNRIRRISMDGDIAQGSLNEIYLEHKKFFVRDTYFAGQRLTVPYGDVFYTSKTYNRLDIGWIPFRSNNLEGIFTAGFHFSEGVVDNQQQFTLRYRIDYKSRLRGKH